MLGAKEFAMFCEVVEQIAPQVFDEPVIHLDEGYISAGEAEYGLHNLVQMCRGESRRSTEAQVREFFVGVKATFEEQSEMDTRPNYSQIKLRLMPLEMQPEFSMVEFPVCDAFQTLLAYDNPRTVTMFSSEAMESLPFTKAEIWDLALKNVLAEDPPEHALIQNRPTKYHLLMGDSFFVASRALAIEQLLERRADHGVIFGVPNRHTLLYHVMGDGSTPEAINRMMMMTQKHFEDGPGSITPCLIWWMNGRYETLYYGIKEFQPSAEFIEALGNCTT